MARGQHHYFADDPGPPKRRLHISSLSDGFWEFVVNEFVDGRESTVKDTTDTPFSRILHYPDMYAPTGMVWIDAATGQQVDIYALKHG